MAMASESKECHICGTTPKELYICEYCEQPTCEGHLIATDRYQPAKIYQCIDCCAQIEEIYQELKAEKLYAAHVRLDLRNFESVPCQN